MSDTSEAPKPIKKPIYTRPKFIAWTFVVIVFLFLIFRNLETVTMDVFFMPLRAPAALLYLIFAIIGFMVGWLVRKPKKQAGKD